MRAIIVCAGVIPALRGLDEHMPAAMLPIGDRQFLQYVIEYFVHQGVKEFDFILNHVPEQVEAYVGDGARWGCRARYHLVADHDQSWKSLRLICSGLYDDIALACAECFPAVMPAAGSSMPTAFFHAGNGDPVWSGWALFHSSTVKQFFSADTLEEIKEQLDSSIRDKKLELQMVEEWIGVGTPAHILASQRMLLEERAATMHLTGTQVEKGAWIGRNSSIHPTARLLPPFYLGPNTRIAARTQIGPYAIVGEKCIVDEDSIIEDSMVTPGTYVGQGLELKQTILDRNRLLNVRLDASYLISDAFVAGSLGPAKKRFQMRNAADSLLALLLMALFSPLILALLIAVLLHSRLRIRSVAFVSTPSTTELLDGRIASRLQVENVANVAPRADLWRHFAFEFLPGLFSVVSGSLGICGPRPRSVEELLALPSDWRALCLQCAPGLISEDLVVCSPEASSEERYSAEAYYFARKSFAYDLGLLLRYLERLIAHPSDRAQPASAQIEE